MVQVKVSQHLSIQHIFILPADKIDVYWYLVISSTNNKLHGDAEDMPTITTVYVPVIKSVSTQVFWKWARVARVASDCRLRRNCAATLVPRSLPLHYLTATRERRRKSGRMQGRRQGVLWLDLHELAGAARSQVDLGERWRFDGVAAAAWGMEEACRPGGRHATEAEKASAWWCPA